MIRGFFSLIFRLLALAFIVCAGTVVWIVYDGLYDRGEHADIAVVPGNSILHNGAPSPNLRTRLDGAIKAYRQGKFRLIDVSGASGLNGYDEARGMAQYLKANQVPASAIIEDPEGVNTAATAQNLAKIMKERNLHSVMVITHYYHITRTKLALRHYGITDVSQMHVGAVQKDDAYNVAREVIAIYYYLAKFYILPEAQKLKGEAEKEMPKVKEQIQQKVDKVEKSLQPAKH